MQCRTALLLLLVAVASARQTIRTQDVDTDNPFANVFLQMHSSVRAASLDRAFTAVKDCDVPSDKTTAPCCSGIQCPFKGGMCCPGTKTCCPGGTSCMEAIEGVPQQCQSLAFLGEAADTLDAKIKYLKAASAEKARRTQIILDQVALMTTGGLNNQAPAPQPRCTGPQPCLAADLLAPNSFPASQLTNADGSSLSASQAAALQAQQPQAPVDPNPYVPREPSPEQKDMSCVCPPVAPCGSNYCAPPPKCACDLFWSSHLQHQGRIALDDQEPGDENYNTAAQNSTSSEDLANAIARAAAEAEEKAEAERQAQLAAAEQDAELLKKLFDENDNSSMSAAHSLAVQEAKHVSESIKILDDITAMDVPELAPAVNLTKGPALKTVDNTMSFMDPNNDPLVLKAQNRGGENVANRAIDDVDDRRDDGPPQAGDNDVFERSDTISKELQRDAASTARHQQTNIVVNLQMSRNGTGAGGHFSHRPKIPTTEADESSNEPEAKDAAEAREQQFSKKEEKKQEMLARKLLNRRKLETRTEYCVSRSPAAKGPLRTLMFSNDPTCGAEHAPIFEQYARFYAFPFPVAGSAAYCVATTRDSMWRMQIVVDDTSCVTKTWNQEFVFYAYPTYHPGTAPFCIKESTNGNSVKRQYIDPGRTACSSEYWKQIGVFYAFQTPGDPSSVPSPAELKADGDSEDSEESSEESTEPQVSAAPGAGAQVTPVRFASAPPMPPSAQPRFVQRTRMPVAPPTPGSYDAPKRREKAAKDERNWKDLMANMGPRAAHQQPLAPWANRH